MLASEALKSGRGLEKLRQFIRGQGGDDGVIQDYGRFPQAAYRCQVVCEKDGFVEGLKARTVGIASQHAGAGRRTKEDSIDLSAGILLKRKVGDAVKKGELLAEVMGNDPTKVELAAEEVKRAFIIGAAPLAAPPLVKKVLMSGK